MALINYATREINAKIVYYGPGLSGKTTNIHYVFRKVKPDNKGKLISLATQGDRTLFFDFLPVELGTIKGFRTRFHLYTVPGQVFYNSTRKMVLKGSDGVVFVADSQKMMMDENLQSLENLKSNLRDMGLSYGSFPVVLQYNKRDLPNAAPAWEMNEFLNPSGLPFFEASAISGDGVLKTLAAIVKYVLHDLKETPHAHSLDIGAIEEAAVSLADGVSPLFIDSAEPPAVKPEIRALAEEEAEPLPATGVQVDAHGGVPVEAFGREPETLEMSAVDAGGEGAGIELPEATPEFFGAYDDASPAAQEDDEVYDAVEVMDRLGDMIAEPEAGKGYTEPQGLDDAPEFSRDEIETFSSLTSYDTFPATPADTLHEVLEEYPTGPPSGLTEQTGTGIPDTFDPDMDVDLTSGLDLPSLVEFSGDEAGEADETRPAASQQTGPDGVRESNAIRIKKSFRLPVRLSTRSGVREVELKLNVDLGITGEGLEAVDAVEILEPRPDKAEPKGGSMHEKDQSKHPPPVPPAKNQKSAEITEPMLRMRKKGMLEKMFGR